MPADQAIASRDVAKVRQAAEQDVRYANITIIDGIGASQLGIGMVSARIAEIVVRDERAVVPIGVFNPKNLSSSVLLPLSLQFPCRRGPGG
jgi:L-lactate dehydrogenase